jgi:hypothetical protein
VLVVGGNLYFSATAKGFEFAKLQASMKHEFGPLVKWVVVGLLIGVRQVRTAFLSAVDDFGGL